MTLKTKVIDAERIKHMTKLTKLQKRLLAMIPIGMDRPRPRVEIETTLKLKKRSIENVVERLRLKDWPIVAVKSDDFHGYYLPQNEFERQIGLSAYKKQIISSQKIVNAVESSDLSNLKERLSSI